jgi:hypothetical protein
MDAAARLKGDRNRRESAGAGEASSLDSRGQERLGVRVRLLHISAVGGGGMQSSVAASQLLFSTACGVSGWTSAVHTLPPPHIYAFGWERQDDSEAGGISSPARRPRVLAVGLQGTAYLQP